MRLSKTASCFLPADPTAPTRNVHYRSSALSMGFAWVSPRRGGVRWYPSQVLGAGWRAGKRGRFRFVFPSVTASRAHLYSQKPRKTLLARPIARLGQQKWTESDTVCRVQAACLVRGGSCSGLSITWKDSAAASRTLVPANKHSGYGRWASCIWKRLKRCTCLFLC